MMTARLPKTASGALAGLAEGWRTRLARLPVARRDALLLVGLGALARGLTAALIHQPGYIDAAYYYAVARNVAAGRGLTEDFIITYLVPAAHVTHPSNLYWMPGASLVLVPFLWLFGGAWWAALLPNVLLTGALPALAYAVGRELAGTRRVALGAGLLTLASGFYYPLYDPLPDNFGLYAWTAGGALLLMTQGMRGKPGRFALAGACAGLAHLARAEAPLLLAVAVVAWWWTRRPRPQTSVPADAGSGEHAAQAHGEVRQGILPLPAWSLAALFALYLLVMAPWFARNLLLVGAPLPPGGFQTVWLRSYNDFFSYGLPITPSTYLAWGLPAILGSKVEALATNGVQLAAVMEFALAPLAVLGAWRLRRTAAALPWLLYALGAYLALALVFTFPGANGGVLHTEVAALPFLNIATVVGLDAAIDRLGRRGDPAARARRANERKRVYLGAAVALSALLSAFLVLANAHDWDSSAAGYARAGQIIAADAGRARPPGESSTTREASASGPIVMVEDPSFYYVVTGQRAIVIPDQGIATMRAAAQRYGARYLVIEPLHSPAQNGLWAGAERTPLLTLLWSGSGVKVYRWNW